MRLPAGSHELAAATIGRQEDNIVVLTDKNKAIYMRLNRAPLIQRGRPGGDIIISVKAKERVSSVVTYQARVLATEAAE
jgi:hypothetical protein